MSDSACLAIAGNTKFPVARLNQAKSEGPRLLQDKQEERRI